MKSIALAFTRTLFFLLSIIFMTLYMLSSPGDRTANGFIGLILGIVLALLLFGFDILFRRYNLRSFNIALIGLFFGYLMAIALILIFNAIIDISTPSLSLPPHVLQIVKISLFLFALYLGTMLTLRASDELSISIPFIRFTPLLQKKNDLLLDGTLLSDPRIIDLASSGLLDRLCIIPRFILKELYEEAESLEESVKSKAKRSLETLKKLEELPDLALRYNETDFSELTSSITKLIRLARFLEANIFTADASRLQMAAIEGVKIINLNFLANALKPLMQAGEQLHIKIQRFGKEAHQGVGYLDDGTMVVVNGGGDYLGETIDVQVLSVKHSSTGRIVFCNTLEQHAY